MNASTCIRCGGPRAEGPECPRCGVVYARAESRAASQREAEPSSAASAPPAPEASAAALFARRQALGEARTELWLARLAVPGTLLASWLLVHTQWGRFLARTLFGMWLHELGHAVGAWLCGFPAFPGPWFTPVADERSPLFALALMGGLGWAVWRGWTGDQRGLAAAGIGVLSLQLVCTLGLSGRAAHTLITFSGHAGCLVFGAALMAMFFVPPEHKLHRDWLRWGFLVIGAAGFADTFDLWWRARTDYSVIGFGEVEGRGATDASVLVREGWSVPTMTGRYAGIGVLCLLALAALQFRHLRRTRAALETLEAE